MYPIVPTKRIPEASIMKKWFQGGPEVDEQVKTLFEEDIKQLLDTQLSSSEFLNQQDYKAEAYLAMIITLDQFTRNIFRGTPRAFAGDRLALKLALEVVDKKLDLQVLPIYRSFFYFPFEHDEMRKSQLMSVALFQDLVKVASEDEKPVLMNFLDFAERHKTVIDRFGRYPHRNKILGRKDTQEETDYLQNGGESF